MLTPKQEAFVKGIIDGLSQSDAYRSAYNAEKMSDKTITEKASVLIRKDNIRARIEELRAQMITPSIMTAQERLELLTRMAKGEEPEKVAQLVNGEMVVVDFPASLKTKQNAIDIMNKMTGEYTQKIEGTLNVQKLEDLL